MPEYSQNFVFEGLTTLTFTVPTAGPYIMNGKISVPRQTDSGGQSQVVCVIKQNGSTVQTSLTGCDGFGIDLVCAAGDSIAVQLTSAAAIDQGANVIKTNLSISQGQ